MTSAGVQREVTTGEMKILTILAVRRPEGYDTVNQNGDLVCMPHTDARTPRAQRVPCSHKTNTCSELLPGAAAGSGGASVCGAGVRKITLEYWVRV